MFDLEQAIETWRAPFLRRHIYSQRDVSELELHLRDVLNEELGRSLSENDAFIVAVSRVGDEARLRDQFRQNWKDLNPIERYGRALSAEFRGWPAYGPLIGYSIARLVSGLVGYAALLLTVASIVTIVRGTLLNESLSTYGVLLSRQGAFLMFALAFMSMFNLFPFKRWENRWTDWLRLLYSAWVVLLTCIFLLFAPIGMAGVSLFVNSFAVASLALGPILWLKQVFRRRDYHLDLDSLVVSN